MAIHEKTSVFGNGWLSFKQLNERLFLAHRNLEDWELEVRSAEARKRETLGFQNKISREKTLLD